MELFLDPLVEEVPFRKPAQRGDPSNGVALGLRERYGHGLAPTCEGRRHLDELALVLGNIVGVPECRQFRDGIGLRQGIVHLALFHSVYRRSSCSLIGRAVTGYALPSGNWMTMHSSIR